MSNKWAKAYTGDKARVDKMVGGGSYSQNRRVPKGTPIPFRGNIPLLNNTERYALVQDLAFYRASGGVTVASKVVYGTVYTPSTRLRARINVFFEPSENKGTDPTFNVTPTWEVREMAKHPFTGYESPLQQAHAGNLPDEYTADNAGELLRVAVTLDSSQFKTSYVPLTSDCVLHMAVTWEPNTFIDPADLKRYYEKCRLGVGQVLQIANNSVP